MSNFLAEITCAVLNLHWAGVCHDKPNLKKVLLVYVDVLVETLYTSGLRFVLPDTICTPGKEITIDRANSIALLKVRSCSASNLCCIIVFFFISQINLSLSFFSKTCCGERDVSVTDLLKRQVCDSSLGFSNVLFH